MDINRNQFFLAGLVVLFLGIEFRMVESAVLTPQFTRLLAEGTASPALAAADATSSLVGSSANVSPMTVRPPEWLGYALLSIGSVLILHAFAMRRPGG
jgi:hypothetical protein